MKHRLRSGIDDRAQLKTWSTDRITLLNVQAVMYRPTGVSGDG